MKPFRWNLKKKEQLGGLLTGKRSPHYSGYINDIRKYSAQIFGRSEDRRMIFVGRSPANIFDYLSGVFQDTLLDDRIENLNISNRFYEINKLAKEIPDSYSSLKEHFKSLSLSPMQLISSKRGICFVDLVSEGSTFDRLYEFIHKWSNEEKVDSAAVWNKIKFLGLTNKTKNSPNTYRWSQDAIWLEDKVDIKAQSISIPWQMWDHMGNYQSKSSNTNKPEMWNDENILLPPREKERLEALRTAYDIYLIGLQETATFSKEIAKTPEYKEKWIRDASLFVKK